MSKLLESILKDKERIVPILGLHGIGKSAFAKNTLHYLADRKVFTGGILFIQSKGIVLMFTMLKLLMTNILEFLDLDSE